VNRGTTGVNSLPKTVTQQRRDCDLNPGPTAPESSTLTTRLPSHVSRGQTENIGNQHNKTDWSYDQSVCMAALERLSYYSLIINCLNLTFMIAIETITTNTRQLLKTISETLHFVQDYCICERSVNDTVWRQQPRVHTITNCISSYRDDTRIIKIILKIV